MNPYEFLIVAGVILVIWLGYLARQSYINRNTSVKRELATARKELRIAKTALTKVTIAETVEAARLTASIAVDETSRLEELES